MDKEFIHPEQKEGEVFLINLRTGETWFQTNLPKWIKSTRIGEIAYTTGGKEHVKGYKPLFGLLRKTK